MVDRASRRQVKPGRSSPPQNFRHPLLQVRYSTGLSRIQDPIPMSSQHRPFYMEDLHRQRHFCGRRGNNRYSRQFPFFFVSRFFRPVLIHCAYSWKLKNNPLSMIKHQTMRSLILMKIVSPVRWQQCVEELWRKFRTTVMTKVAQMMIRTAVSTATATVIEIIPLFCPFVVVFYPSPSPYCVPMNWDDIGCIVYFLYVVCLSLSKQRLLANE